jgi:hypothetical protein
MEGGGDSREGKARLRQGMSGFLRSLNVAANQKRLKSSRAEAATMRTTPSSMLKTAPETFSVLLVDSEEPIAGPRSPRTHLTQRDGWILTGASEESIHLMIQVMETWIVADADAVARYYKQHFLRNALPRTQNLEAVEKARIHEALKRATAKTQKGEYRKIGHAAALLELVDPLVVRRRCPSCDRLFATLTQRIAAA